MNRAELCAILGYEKCGKRVSPKKNKKSPKKLPKKPVDFDELKRGDMVTIGDGKLVYMIYKSDVGKEAVARIVTRKTMSIEEFETALIMKQEPDEKYYRIRNVDGKAKTLGRGEMDVFMHKKAPEFKRPDFKVGDIVISYSGANYEFFEIISENRRGKGKKFNAKRFDKEEERIYDERGEKVIFRKKDNYVKGKKKINGKVVNAADEVLIQITTDKERHYYDDAYKSNSGWYRIKDIYDPTKEYSWDYNKQEASYLNKNIPYYQHILKFHKNSDIAPYHLLTNF